MKIKKKFIQKSKINQSKLSRFAEILEEQPGENSAAGGLPQQRLRAGGAPQPGDSPGARHTGRQLHPAVADHGRAPLQTSGEEESRPQDGPPEDGVRRSGRPEPGDQVGAVQAPDVAQIV